MEVQYITLSLGVFFVFDMVTVPRTVTALTIIVSLLAGNLPFTDAV